MFQIVTIAVDSYAETGDLVSTLMGARAIDEALDPHTLLDVVLNPPSVNWRQLTISEVRDRIQHRPEPHGDAWQQLSIF